MIDEQIAEFDRLIAGKPPERIFSWQYTQLSIARFYCGCKAYGHEYLINYNDPGQPLVRADVIKRSEIKSIGELF